MPNNNEYNKTSVLVVGAGPAGLAAAIQLKVLRPDMDVCVIEKALDLGNHNLSGAVLEKEPLHSLLDAAKPGWQEQRCRSQCGFLEPSRSFLLLGKLNERTPPVKVRPCCPWIEHSRPYGSADMCRASGQL